MNGPEHFREAERLIAGIPGMRDHAERSKMPAEVYVAATTEVLAEAQVHATLALAAATAAPAASAYDGDEDHSRSRGWAGVA